MQYLGGDLEKVVNKRFRFFAFPIRWHLGDGSMVRCVAEIGKDDLNSAKQQELKLEKQELKRFGMIQKCM